LEQLAAQGLLERLAFLDAAARQQPVRLLALLLAQQQDGVAAAKQPADPDAGAVAHRARTAEEPKPRSALSDGGSSPTSTSSTAGTGTIRSWAMRSPGAIVNGSERSPFCSPTLSSPR